MKHKLKYLSWSQISLYLNDPHAYFKQYVLGIKRIPTEAMILGRIYHQAFENPDSKLWVIKLKEQGFTADKERMIWEAIKYLNTYNKGKWPKLRENDAKFQVAYDPIDLLAKYDGLDKPKNITEYKTGSSNWTKERVQEDGQLKLYSLVHKLEFKKMPTITLHSFNTRSGRPITYKIKHKVGDLKEVKRLINEAYDGITAGIWE